MPRNKAARMYAFNEPLSVEDSEIPIRRAGEAVVKVMAAGICSSDRRATGPFLSCQLFQDTNVPG
jgi:D-arabinose 1-dehydrogenase-like Zn-dependent alcohol dehydrogenase